MTLLECIDVMAANRGRNVTRWSTTVTVGMFRKRGFKAGIARIQALGIPIQVHETEPGWIDSVYTLTASNVKAEVLERGLRILASMDDPD